MPELAAAYAVGFVANLVFLGIILFRQSRKETAADDPIAAHIILGIFCAFLSWFGLFFFLLIELSMIYLSRRKSNQQL